MTSPDRPEVIVFDWGGVLLKICRSLEEGCARAGIPLPEDAHAPHHRERRSQLANQFQLGKIDEAQFSAGLAETAPATWTPEDALALHDAWLIEEYEGAEDLTRDLAAAGVTTAMLSNTNARHWETQWPSADGTPARFPAPGHLNTRLASHLIGLAKPDPAIYHAAAETLGFAQRPASMLFFDDLEDNIKAARAAGWQAELIDHAGDPPAQMRRHLTDLGVL